MEQPKEREQNLQVELIVQPDFIDLVEQHYQFLVLKEHTELLLHQHQHFEEQEPTINTKVKHHLEIELVELEGNYVLLELPTLLIAHQDIIDQ